MGLSLSLISSRVSYVLGRASSAGPKYQDPRPRALPLYSVVTSFPGSVEGRSVGWTHTALKTSNVGGSLTLQAGTLSSPEVSLFAHLLIHPLIHPPIHPPTPSTHPPTHPSTHLSTHPSTHSIHPLHPPIHPATPSTHLALLPHLLMHSFIHLITHSLIVIHSSIQ